MEYLKSIEELEEFLYEKCEEVECKGVAFAISQFHNCQEFNGCCEKCWSTINDACASRANLAQFDKDVESIRHIFELMCLNGKWKQRIENNKAYKKEEDELRHPW